jgi:hypothetical protein
MAELERVFNAPVIESYGMTEASHQMTSNPLPPRKRKPGSVGIAAGPEVVILGPDWSVLPVGTCGEVAVRGPNVTPGYENNPEANAAAFAGGWFRTGDQGYVDEEGYLSLTGRLKEIINRGGEKISPREIDEALLDHPAVAQALAFAISHPTLGEDVGAAVVLREGRVASQAELRAFAAQRLADFKVPRTVVLLEEIPKGPTGKPQRIGLAERLGLGVAQGDAASPPPRTEAEKRLAQIWSSVLRCERVGVCEDFFAVGGDSLGMWCFWPRSRQRSERGCRWPHSSKIPPSKGWSRALPRTKEWRASLPWLSYSPPVNGARCSVSRPLPGRRCCTASSPDNSLPTNRSTACSPRASTASKLRSPP